MDQPCRTLSVDGRYLNLPVRTGAPKQRMVVAAGNERIDEFDIELVASQPQFYVFLDLAPFRGRAITVTLPAAQDPDGMLAALTISDDICGMADLYREPLRPQLHFSTRRGWINDPNGLVFHGGGYHMYYQHNPYGWAWGNMHWGHAVSRDLVHWQELPIALSPRAYGDWCYSGSAAVDWQNTSGFGDGRTPPLVIAYTSTGRGECLAYSLDDGRTFTEYEGNPVVAHRGRDPRILWHSPTARWVMAVYDETGPEGRDHCLRNIAFYSSPDLKHWRLESRIEGYYECPELFELALDRGGETRWVVYGADGAYSVGQFDGRVFTPETKPIRYHYGNCFYASQTFSDLPAHDARRIQLAWGRVSAHGMAFNQMMLLPVELTLHTTPDGPRLRAWPVRELASLVRETKTVIGEPLGPGDDPLADLGGELWDLEATIAVGDAAAIVFDVRGKQVRYDVAAGLLQGEAQQAPLPATDRLVRIRMVIDRTTIEIFGDDGFVYLPLATILAKGPGRLSLMAEGGTARVERLEARALRSIWE